MTLRARSPRAGALFCRGLARTLRAIYTASMQALSFYTSRRLQVRAKALLGAAVLWALTACESPAKPDSPAPTAPATPAVPVWTALEDGWDRGSTRSFQNRFEAWNQIAGLQWEDSAWSALLAALRAPADSASAAERALRAALCCSLDQRPGAIEALYARLELRLEPDVRGYAAAEIVAARALGQRQPLPQPWLEPLRALAVGPHPHPVLDVRVECARAFLDTYDPSTRPLPLRSQEVLRFLLKVLRAETPDQRIDPPDWKRVETLAWTKGRAAETLSAWVPDAGYYTPDGSWPAQNAWATAVEQALGLAR